MDSELEEVGSCTHQADRDHRAFTHFRVYESRFFMLRKLTYLTKTVKIPLIFVSDSLCLWSQGRSCQLVQLRKKEDQEVKTIDTSHSATTAKVLPSPLASLIPLFLKPSWPKLSSTVAWISTVSSEHHCVPAFTDVLCPRIYAQRVDTGILRSNDSDPATQSSLLWETFNGTFLLSTGILFHCSSPLLFSHTHSFTGKDKCHWACLARQVTCVIALISYHLSLFSLCSRHTVCPALFF